MNKKPRNLPAFPLASEDDDTYTQEGMSLRDWFAGLALGGICTATPANYERGPCNAAIVERAFLLADLMLAKREAQP